MDAQWGALILSNIIWAGVAVAVHWKGKSQGGDDDAGVIQKPQEKVKEEKEEKAKVTFVTTKPAKDQEKELKEWHRKYEKITADKDKAEADLEELKSKHDEWKAKMSRDKAKLQEKIRVCGEQVVKYKQESSELKEHQAEMHAKLREETNLMETEKQTLAEAAQEAEATFKKASKSVVSVEKQCKIAQRQADDIAKKQAEIEADIPRLKDQIEERTREVEELEVRNASLREELQMLLPDGQDLQEYLDEKKAARKGKGKGKSDETNGGGSPRGGKGGKNRRDKKKKDSDDDGGDEAW